MKPSNRGRTSLKRRRRAENTMDDFDGLPREVRTWLAAAALPWRPKSVRRTYARLLAETRSPSVALAELDRIQQRLIAKDARVVWGGEHPQAAPAASKQSNAAHATSA